jgi:hypothetical protein
LTDSFDLRYLRDRTTPIEVSNVRGRVQDTERAAGEKSIKINISGYDPVT